MQKVHFWNNFAVKVSLKFYLLSFWLIPDEPKEEGGNVFFFPSGCCIGCQFMQAE